MDGIRGLAILGVIVYHTMPLGDSAHGVLRIWRAFTDSSWAGVDLFFVLSGFLITGILLDSRAQKGYYRNFYARRALRIMPLYYGVLVVVLLVVPALVGASRLPGLYSRLIANQFWLWTFLQNYLQSRGAHQLPGLGHFWSLAVEEQFYWFWPIVVYLTTRRTLLHLCMAICLFEPLFRLALLECGYTLWSIRELTFTKMDALLYGAIAALLFRDPEMLRWRRYWVPVLTAAAIGVLALVAFRNGGFVPYENFLTAVGGYSALGVVFAVFIYAGAIGTGTVARSMSHPLLCWFGRYSYALYIFHPPLVFTYQAVVDPRLRFSSLTAGLIRFLVITLISSGMAWLSWVALESRFLKLKKYFEHSGSSHGQTQSSFANVADAIPNCTSRPHVA